MKTSLKKGFTLIELIGVVVIISVLTLIAVPAYTSTKRRVLNGQYNNLVSLIEVAAQKYGSSSKERITNVQKLIDEGLLETDDGTYIYDPRDNSIMNCYAVEIDYDRGSYVADFLEKKSYDDGNNNCDLSSAMQENESVRIEAYDSIEQTHQIEDLSNWYKGDMYLYTSETYYTSYNWITNTGKTARDPYLELKDQKTFNGSVTVLTTDETGNRYYGSANIKIDNEAPKISKVELIGSENWNEERSIDINASDGNGSGIAGYYVGENPCTSDEIEWQSSPEESYKYNLSIINQFTEEKEYHVCVKDGVGNIGEYSDTITISKSDNIEPTCEITVNGTEGNNGWYISDITFSVTGSDSESGIDETKTVTPGNVTTDGEHTVTGKVYDYAGNEGTCSITVKRDATEPSCTSSGGSSSWTNGDITLTGTCSDSGSGCVEPTVTNSYTTDTNTTTASPGTVYDNAGNSKSCPANQTVKIDKTAPTVTFNPNGNSSWLSEASSTVTFSDTGGSGLSGTHEYQFSNNSVYSFASGSVLSSTCGYSGNAGLCQLYVTVCDNAGNCAQPHVDFNVDRQAPSLNSISMSTVNTENGERRRVVVGASDSHVGMHDSGGTNRVRWQYDHMCYNCSKTSCDCKTSTGGDQSNSGYSHNSNGIYYYYQNFGYSGSTRNYLSLTLTIYDKLGNSTSASKTCYYSNNTCS